MDEVIKQRIEIKTNEHGYKFLTLDSWHNNQLQEPISMSYAARIIDVPKDNSGYLVEYTLDSNGSLEVWHSKYTGLTYIRKSEELITVCFIPHSWNGARVTRRILETW